MPHLHYGWYTLWLEVFLGGGTASPEASYVQRLGVPITYHMATDGMWCVTLNNSTMTEGQQ